MQKVSEGGCESRERSFGETELSYLGDRNTLADVWTLQNVQLYGLI